MSEAIIIDTIVDIINKSDKYMVRRADDYLSISTNIKYPQCKIAVDNRDICVLIFFDNCIHFYGCHASLSYIEFTKGKLFDILDGIVQRYYSPICSKQ